LKLASLLKPSRYPRVVLFALMFVATPSIADASTYCLRARELPPISDPQVKGRIEERLQAIPVMKNHQVRVLEAGFAIAWQDEEECRRSFRCYHLLLDIRDGAATIVFAYRGSGTIWELGTPPSTWSDSLQDHYSLKAFETDDSNWVQVQTPRLLGPVWVGAIPSDDKNRWSCGHLKRM
jgi:hypothetical protein